MPGNIEQELRIFQVDAFTREVFSGNPAAVVPLKAWLPDALMQDIAAENNLAETAFVVEDGGNYSIRWFTPECEVDLCGHATLAAAYVFFKELEYPEDAIEFDSRSGPLRVQRDAGTLAMDLPASTPAACDTPQLLKEALGLAPLECLRSTDYIAVLQDASMVLGLNPDLAKLVELDARGLIVTAPGDDCDFVARFFAPSVGIPEDPVTGSAYCVLTPYWAEKTGRNIFRAKQLSRRGGEIECTLEGDRVILRGQCAAYMNGTINLQKR